MSNNLVVARDWILKQQQLAQGKSSYLIFAWNHVEKPVGYTTTYVDIHGYRKNYPPYSYSDLNETFRVGRIQ